MPTASSTGISPTRSGPTPPAVPDGQLQSGPLQRLAQDLILLDDGRIVVAGTTQDAAVTEIGLIRVLTEQPPTISISDATVTEGDSGTVNAVFTVTLSKAYRMPITVNVATADGTAIAGTDYFALPLTTLSFAPGVTSITVTIPVVGDTLDEPDETFSVNLSSPVLGTLGRGQGTGFILDNDPTPPPPPPPPAAPAAAAAPAAPAAAAPAGPVRSGRPQTASVTGVERVFVRRGGRRVFVGVRLLFNGVLDPGVASQTGLYRVNQRRRAVTVNQAQVGANTVTLILGRVPPGPLRGGIRRPDQRQRLAHRRGQPRRLNPSCRVSPPRPRTSRWDPAGPLVSIPSLARRAVEPDGHGCPLLA